LAPLDQDDYASARDDQFPLPEAALKRILPTAAIAIATIAGEAAPQHCAAHSLSDGLSAVAKILPPEPGRTACFRGLYDERHLSQHPRQTITEMLFIMRVEGIDAKGGPVLENPDHVVYRFALELKRRGDRRPLRTNGECNGDRVAECFVDCDGGGVTVERMAQGGGLTVRLQGEGIAFGNDCDTTRGAFVGPGADDKIFELGPAPATACRSLERAQLTP
jgi:hypothetical protein